MGPAVNMTITLENGQLTSQMLRQGKVPPLAESETVFYRKVVDAHIEFPKSPAGQPASQLTVHKNGGDGKVDSAAVRPSE
jgi:hypothetical protein